MKRSHHPQLSPSCQQALTHYEEYLRTEQDLSPASLRNYLSDLRQFVAWCEQHETDSGEISMASGFNPALITTPLLIRYRTYLQTDLALKPASVNRFLVSLKKYCSWVVERG